MDHENRHFPTIVARSVAFLYSESSSVRINQSFKRSSAGNAIKVTSRKMPIPGLSALNSIQSTEMRRFSQQLTTKSPSQALLCSICHFLGLATGKLNSTVDVAGSTIHSVEAMTLLLPCTGIRTELDSEYRNATLLATIDYQVSEPSAVVLNLIEAVVGWQCNQSDISENAYSHDPY
jgi:hypothetical protein